MSSSTTLGTHHRNHTQYSTASAWGQPSYSSKLSPTAITVSRCDTWCWIRSPTQRAGNLSCIDTRSTARPLDYYCPSGIYRECNAERQPRGTVEASCCTRVALCLSGFLRWRSRRLSHSMSVDTRPVTGDTRWRHTHTLSGCRWNSPCKCPSFPTRTTPDNIGRCLQSCWSQEGCPEPLPPPLPPPCREGVASLR